MPAALGCLALTGGDFFQDAAPDFLQFAEPRQVVLKIVIQELRVLRAQLRPENHVTQFYRMRKKGIFLQFLERNLGIVVIHGFPPAEKRLYSIVLSCRFEGGFAQRVKEEVLRGGCRNRHELVARDFRSDAYFAILGGLDTHDLTQAADIYIAGLCNLLGKCDDKFNLVANFEFSIGKEVEPAVTEIPRMRVQFASFGLPRQNPHG